MLPQIACGDTSIGLGPYFLINFSRTFGTLEYVVSQNGTEYRKFCAGTLE
jgi:hypothetical protein